MHHKDSGLAAMSLKKRERKVTVTCFVTLFRVFDDRLKVWNASGTH